ncbi:MAG: hypothetical protein EKK62_03170 [Acidimicrobiia bacterium]|nr:MAG: hypothetical protein EKK62_03170 [Acidimicrobiia bacterium]
MTSLEFDVPDLDTPIALRRPGVAEFSAWLDSFLSGQAGDASHNLVTGCAVRPSAGELAEIFADGFGFLPGELAASLVEAAGLPGGPAGLGETYALVGLKDAEAQHAQVKVFQAILDAAPVDSLSDATNEEIQRTQRSLEALKSEIVPIELMTAARKATRRPFFCRMADGSWWACKAPGTAQASAYEDVMMVAVQGKGSRYEPLRALVLACVISPEPEVAKVKIEETPAIPYLLARALRGAGGEGKAVARVSS